MRDALKRLIDFVGASLVLVIISPLLLAVAIAVRVSMGNPLLYRDERAGRGGVSFALLKFRTMRALRPGETIPDSDADRITPAGRFLRRVSLDELPSLLNVLTGDMSLVGPRPLPIRYLPRYTTHQRRRLDVRPGITGWAQVHGRNATTWTERLELDTWYVEHRTLRVDLEVLVRTVGIVLTGRGVANDEHATMPELEAVRPSHKPSE
ncbi:MAG: sugar transferase [Acidimicrobiia bacterium]